jgi:ribosomal silencing factor RsfS
MIVKSEEKVLVNCLESVSELCDEFIIIDTVSEDNMKEIANRITDK